MASTNRENWFVKMALREEELGADFGAGAFQLGQSSSDANASNAAAKSEETKVIFGRFIQLMRRKKGITIERLAEKADVDLVELVEIEDDISHVPEPRTVYQLAQFFDLAASSLMQVAGLTTMRDSRLLSDGVRFAARSNPVNALNREEQEALEEFVALLNKQD